MWLVWSKRCAFLAVLLSANRVSAVRYKATLLHPVGFDNSIASGVSGASQVGWGAGAATGGYTHALLWSGSAASVVDLNPGGFDSSNATGVSGASQVGYGAGPATGGTNHALLWSGSAASAVDMHPYLTGLDPDFTFSSAFGIADNGTIVGYASRDGITRYAILWTPIPEPSSLVLLALAVPALVRHRKNSANLRRSCPGMVSPAPTAQLKERGVSDPTALPAFDDF